MRTTSRGDAVPLHGRASIICLQLALVGMWMERICACACVRVSVEAGAIVPSDPFTLNHMSNLILVSHLN